MSGSVYQKKYKGDPHTLAYGKVQERKEAIIAHKRKLKEQIEELNGEYSALWNVQCAQEEREKAQP